MQCISCDSEINPKWKHAIDQNVCPYCGQAIMDENLKSLLSILADTMEKMQEYPAQLNDWMLSNYNFIKTDSEQLINYLPKDSLKDLKKIEDDKSFQERKENKKFTVKVKTEHGEQEVQAEKIQSEDKTNEFFKRAEAVKPRLEGFKNASEKTEHLKKLAQQIKRAGTPLLANEDGDSEFLSAELIDAADPDAVVEMRSLLEGNEISSSLEVNSEDDIPPVVLNMASRAKSGVNPKDMIKLQQLQNRVNQSKNNFESGVNRGKGGFSRA
jgi:hypothetical protein